ncbi:MAG: malonyl-[acyl-carrier protein] O-methyltransferase BioC [Gammaproteobacteria bacterium]|jgi:malonyl-CoA O-methyltransferase|nr:malonyl-[acyl-carrier protein] O-methyltransferase BioC [Gammaproteobacteria bacterium]
MKNAVHSKLEISVIKKAFNRAAQTYDEASVLQTITGEALIARLSLLKLNPRTILDLGAGTGKVTSALSQYYPKADVIALDLAEQLLKKIHSYDKNIGRICAQAPFLPVADHSVDFVFSNASLHWFGDLTVLFAEVQRVLTPNGLFLFSLWGTDTLFELKKAWQAVDQYIHVNSFYDMHNVGDALIFAGFTEPVLDVDHYTLTYSTLNDLFYDLKAMGSHNAAAARFQGLTGKGCFANLEASYEIYRQEEGLPATYEVIFGHAFAPDLESTKSKTKSSGKITRVPVSAILSRVNKP